MTLKDHKYTAHATARGQGRDGEVESDDDCGLKLRLAMPHGQNPEQLFAMGYSACLLSAIQLASNNLGKTDEARHAVVHTQVHLGKPNDMDGQELVDAGHEACPYSRALKHGAKVTVTKGI
ncbi:OsmC/Ohr family [Irpex lacteus]|nr:OsmC/Ohr family [Irpex lacteus]